MWTLPCRILPPLPEDLPEDMTELVTAEFVDAHGQRWTFRDKLAIFRGSDGPDGIRCRLLRVGRVDGKFVYEVSTAQPDHVAAEQDEREEFVTTSCVFQADPEAYRARFSEIPRDPPGAQPEAGIDIDFLQHRIALALGILPPDTPFSAVKWMYWTAHSDLGDFTLAVIRLLLASGALAEVDGDATLLHFVNQ